MTFILYRKLLRDVRIPLLVVCLIVAIFSGLWVKIAQRVTTEIFPFFNGLALAQKMDPKVFDEVLFKGPGKISQAVMGGADVRFDRTSDFLAIELLHPVILALTCIWAVGRAAGAVAGELDRGTMELLLSQPVPRNRLVLAHFLVDLTVIPAICGSVVLGTQLGLAAVGPFVVDYSSLDKLMEKAPIKVRNPDRPTELEVDATAQWKGAMNLAGFAFAVSGFTLAISAAGRSRGKVTGLAVLVVVLMFVANVLGQLWSAAAFLRPASVFFYYQPQKLWLHGDGFVDLGDAWNAGQPLLRLPVLAVLFGAGAAGYLLALLSFTRRDLPAPL
ncbi:MAG TPA: ABC transporter permease subunit [Fimbriiglobus sp.]